MRCTAQGQKKMGTNTEMQDLMCEEAFSVRVVTLGEVSQRCCEVSVLGDTWNPSGRGPGACSG